MFWWIYITAVLICSYQVGKIFKKNKLLVFFFTAIILRINGGIFASNSSNVVHVEFNTKVELNFAFWTI